MDAYVELQDLSVLRVKADMQAMGPPEAFRLLESKVPTLKGRKFYGTYQFQPSGEGEYYACVVRIDSDDPASMQLEAGMISGGRYVRRKLANWEKNIPLIGKLFEEMARTYDVDPARPSVEFYRSHDEMHLFLPVRSFPPGAGPVRRD
jgi:hypothetical protein